MCERERERNAHTDTQTHNSQGASNPKSKTMKCKSNDKRNLHLLRRVNV